jgi:hypothetical protein
MYHGHSGYSSRFSTVMKNGFWTENTPKRHKTAIETVPRGSVEAPRNFYFECRFILLDSHLGLVI